MKKVSVAYSLVLLVALVVSLIPAATTAKAQGMKKGQLRWHGELVRRDKDNSSLTVRKGTTERTIYVDSSTRWTKSQGKKVEDITEADVPDGSDVICIGKEEDGKFMATRVDLRPPK